MRVMIDLETMSSQRDAAIISIGAVQFGHGIPVDHAAHFYDRIDPNIARMFGHVDKATMEWWDKQDPLVRAEAFGGIKTHSQVLDDFEMWVFNLSNGEVDNVELWSRGADFDLPILQHAYEERGGKYPFNFRKHMCERTVRNLVPSTILAVAEAERPLGTAHNALEDAKNQANYMNYALAHIGWSR